ncbi:SEP-domain-containing protein [Mycena filopes]|nr:SEP-domain-containing protein [Mycena filopes]
MSGSHSDDEDEQETWFAGGQRRRVPGGNLVRDLLQRAEECISLSLLPPPISFVRRSRDVSAIQARRGSRPRRCPWVRYQRVCGRGHTLGGEGVQGSYVPGANEGMEEEGFTVEDRPLMRYAARGRARPRRVRLLAHAPPPPVNVRTGQRVDVQVSRRTEEDYVPPKAKPLGAAVPGASTSTSSASTGSSSTASASARPAAAAGASSITPRFEVDQSLPTTTVRVMLEDGTRCVCAFLLVLSLLRARASPTNQTPPYTIGTTFPNRALADDAATIEVEKLQDTVVVMRWV